MSAPEITHVITTYFKRPKGQPGITMLSSRKMSTEEARRWIDLNGEEPPEYQGMGGDPYYGSERPVE